MFDAERKPDIPFCNIRLRLFISAKLLCGIDPSLFGFLVMLMLLIRNPKVMGEHMVRRWLYAPDWASVAFCIAGMLASLFCPEPDAKNLKSKSRSSF